MAAIRASNFERDMRDSLSGEGQATSPLTIAASFIQTQTAANRVIAAGRPHFSALTVRSESVM